MQKKIIGLNYEINFEVIEDINPSFAKAKISIAYPGKNRNKSKISKEAFEKALPSIKNIPVVGRYLPDDEDFSGHDILITETKDGDCKVENATTPFGVIPESASQYWETKVDKQGNKVTYLCSEAILWKRQQGYDTLVKRGKWGQSMEIGVTSYVIDAEGYCDIQDFYFEALCVLGTTVEPCFEEASIMLEKTDESNLFNRQFTYMLNDFKAELSNININDWFGKKEEKKMDESKVKEIFESFDLEQAETGIEVSENETEFSLKEKIYAYQIERLKEENATLKEDNTEFTRKAHEQEIADINHKFEKLASLDEFKELAKKASDMSPAEYEKECYAILGKLSMKETDSKSKAEFAKQSLNQKETLDEFDDFMEKYGE